MNIRIKYTLFILLVILAGLLSRHFSFIPLWIGDFLYAVLLYFLFRFVFPLRKTKLIVLLSLLFCYLIEISQLYQAAWINDIRNSTLGSLVLGHAFLWSDIVAYTGGVAVAAMVDEVFLQPKQIKM